MRKSIGLLITILFLAWSSSSALADTFSLVDLGSFGGTYSRAQAVNNAGQVAGSSSTSSITWRGYIWEAGSGMQDLGNLAGHNNQETFASDINESGQISGYSGDYNNSRSFIWDNTMQGLGLSYGTFRDSGNAINDNGVITGHWGSHTNWRAYIWDGTGTGMELPKPPQAGAFEWFGNGINNNGAVVGHSYNWSKHNAFIWDSTNGSRILSSDESVARDINNAGLVIGDINNTAYLWDTENVTILGDRSLGTLGGSKSHGIGINEFGSVVGYSKTADDVWNAFLYKDGSMMNLNDLVDTGDFTLAYANDINEVGQIVGTMISNLDGSEHSFLLNPTDVAPVPEPSTMLLLVSGFLGLAGFRRKIFGKR
ncbi:PEP-CTERM sorting domain-containing protein [Thermodesulfobacteriota bacterium]